MGLDDFCNHPSLALGLGLGLGLGLSPSTGEPKSSSNPYSAQRLHKIQEPSLTLSLSGEITHNNNHHNIHAAAKKVDSGDNIKVRFNDNQSGDHLYRQESAASSFSNVSVKREREIVSSEEAETERVNSSRISDEDDDGSNGRKKLRLTKVQSALLEESFKLHSTLNPKQKQDLARELKLTPRQVEVWFQNRRARTKLKQTEVDCEFLKKCCETLTEENRRLQKELQELKALKLAQPLYMQLPAATLTMCPSCERVGGAASASAAESLGKSSFTMAPAPHFYNPFTNPSAAC